MDIKVSPIFIALHVTFLFIDIRLQYYTSYCASSNSVTWRGYTKSVSHSVWQALSVCHAWCLYLIVADSVWVGPNSSKKKGRNGSDKTFGINTEPQSCLWASLPSLQLSPGAGVTLMICSSLQPQERPRASCSCFLLSSAPWHEHCVLFVMALNCEANKSKYSHRAWFV